MGLGTTTVWLVVAGVSLGTYALRSSFLLSIEWLGGLPPSVERVLPFVPVAVLAGLLAPNLLLVDGTLTAGPRLVAGLVAFAVAWYTESILATVGVGMVVLWGLLWL